MSHAIMDLVTQAMSSPWLYAALFALALLDGFFPVVPAETSVITAAVFAASGETNLGLVILVAALGAFIGDHVSYLIGNKAAGRLRERKAFVWARRALAERGGLVLVVARYIPGGRTATTLTMGAVRHPLRSFTFFDAIAASSWAVYSGLIGFFGGMAFENDPVKGLLLGLGIALSITGVVELVRWARKRRAIQPSPERLPADTSV
ncbi:VTT domain-containing protein [Nonomuraea roseoviolacea subsp. roseoviolacea]|uniref:Membrane protein DedA with SNARE-associated domain n=1 Tax=Nonomuraea roseoviolacea subsp. carminata TaxID=160689 RepID=A0ABT1JTU6_9ACTN|nr:DedA family protein [Nonomuraea roseoviolacea]MCP2345178.1 membrane protein DedA with SNARE-associated domain [Nonomuraea roseoviolacea subsp. carminata]